MGSPWQSRPPEGFEKWLENPVLQPTENFASFDDFEVLNGLAEGDEVIISDMRDYLHLREISLKQ